MSKVLMIPFSFIIVLCTNITVFSQSIDLIESSRYVSPPLSSVYTVTNASGEVYNDRLAYNPSFSFNGETVLEIKTFSSSSGEEMELGAAYIQFDDSTISLKGSNFSAPTIGTVTLPFIPGITFNRDNQIGDSLEGSVDASVMLGPIPLNVTITVTYEFLALETVSLDIGTFSDALKLRTVRTISLAKVPLISQDRTEWHHSSASLIQFEDNITGATGFLSSIDPPLPTTYIQSWSLY